MNHPEQTPVLVGIGVATQREEDFRRALQPMDLMLQAVKAAGDDTGSVSAVAGAGYIAVPRGRWSYANPAGEIARSIGADDATTVIASVGVLQQTLIGEACSRIVRGEAHTTLVAGADAGYRLLRARIAGGEATERVQDDAPDISMEPRSELRHTAEKRAGFEMPVGLYAIMESAFRAQRGWSVGEHLDRLAELMARQSRIAADNPHAWKRDVLEANDVRDASDRNPMQAFPYTRTHCSSWNVDQAAALLFCSASRAEALAIPRSQWVYPWVSTESNHMVPVSARADLADCPGARMAGGAALDAAGLAAADLDLVELYSCFPLAIETYAAALGLDLNRDLTVTGGMPLAGGPYNNYVLQATCRTAELLRAGRGRTALVSSVSGVLTKQGFGVWSSEPPVNAFVNKDVTDAVAREATPREVVEDFSGNARVAGYTVVHGRGRQPRGVALVDIDDGRRALATSVEPSLLDAMQTEEFVGRNVSIRHDFMRHKSDHRDTH